MFMLMTHDHVYVLCYDAFMLKACMFKRCMDQQACLLSHIFMTHEANLSGDLLEDEIQVVKEEVAKESNRKEDGSP